MRHRMFRNRLAGTPNRDILPEDAARLGSLIGNWIGAGGLVVTGRDYNPPSRMIKRAVISGLMSMGLDVMDLRDAVLGEVSYAIKRFGASAGIHVSMHPRIKDGIRFRILGNPGYEIMGEGLKNIIEAEIKERPPPTRVGWLYYLEHIHKIYVASLTAFIDRNAIETKGFRIIIDTCYGPADRIIQELLPELNVKYVLLNPSKPGKYESYTYPLRDDIMEVARIVSSTNADIGVILNSDASSILIIDGHGNVLLPEEAALLLAYGAPEGSTVAVESSTLEMLDDWLREKGIRAVRVEGEDELIALTVRERPLMALNSRGNYVHPLFSLGYDAILTLMRILEVISKNNVRPEDILTETRRSLNARRVKLPPEELRGREDYLSFMGGYRGRSGEALILDPHDPDTMIAISNRT
jgi:phosphomannomutase